jgi:hypothetical protein
VQALQRDPEQPLELDGRNAAGFAEGGDAGRVLVGRQREVGDERPQVVREFLDAFRLAELG